MAKIMTSIALGFLLGSMLGWGNGYTKGQEDVWQDMESELIMNQATVYERWLIGHDKN